MAEALRVVRSIAIAWVVAMGLLVLIEFPYRTESPQAIHFEPDRADQNFYNLTYTEQERDLKYVEVARDAAKRMHIEERVHDFVHGYGLQNARVLDIGAGSGLLQDQVQDYTALDISATARRFFHKPFVQADARAMPFRDGEFDAAWSIWVLEHVPNPEQALSEMRRVIKPNGLLLLGAAWLCSPLSANGYHVRPYRDFSLTGKAIKASAALREFPGFEESYLLSTRAIRGLSWSLLREPTKFHYWPLRPNYEQYWEPDSDAVNSMDPYEAYLWFKSRGDICLNCGTSGEALRMNPGIQLIIRIKPQ